MPLRGSGVEGLVVGEDFFPVVGELVEGLDVEAGVALGAFHGGADGVQVGLGSGAGHGGEGHVGDVGSGIGRGHDGGGVESGGVVGVEVDGDADLLLEGGEEFGGGGRVAESGHVFDAKNVGSHFF